MLILATADQVKSMVKAHIEGNDQKFRTIVLQIAAYEARQQHTTFARELKNLIDKKYSNRRIISSNSKVSPLLQVTTPNVSLNDLVVSENIKIRIKRILSEYRNRKKLAGFGLKNRRKILIEGPPGTGKTFTASVIAAQTNQPLYTVQADRLMTKYMGETSVKLRQLFDSIRDNTGVYFFDEFDALGSERSLSNEVGEMRRILNSLLQFIEGDDSDSIIIAATNNSHLLDQALFRRFDDVLHYSLPKSNEIKKIFMQKLSVFQTNSTLSTNLFNFAQELSQAEIVRVCDDAIKESILTDNPITENQLKELIIERQSIYRGKEN